MSRKFRGLTQPLYIVEYYKVTNPIIRKYDVMGSTGNVYNVTIKQKPLCSCPDFQTRRIRCKHIYFILIKVMKIYRHMEDIKKFTKSQLLDLFKNIPKITTSLMITDEQKETYDKYKKIDKKQSIIIKQKPVTDICPICLDDLDNKEELDYCKYSCGNNVHKQCINMWLKNKKTCIYCRQPWTLELMDNSDYINLLGH